MIFTVRDLDMLRLVRQCQYILRADIAAMISATELENLLALKLLKIHRASGALVITAAGNELLQRVCPDGEVTTQQGDREDYVRRRLRVSKIMVTAYCANVNVFAKTCDELKEHTALYPTALNRGRGQNLWGNSRIATLLHLGDYITAAHFVSPEMGHIFFQEECIVLINQGHQFQPLKRAFVLFGEGYAELMEVVD